ncbi:MAG TPA: asparaginase [Vicinamibacterales bacterium]|nr:asparaginase [Vicinamibacterales bacterium]
MTLTPRRTTVATVVLASVLTSTGTPEAQGVRTQSLPLVWILATGGTIAGRGASTGVSDYKSGALAAEELVKAVPEIRQVAEVKVEQLFNVSSGDLTLDNLLTLSKRINTIFATDSRVAGVVVTHGTSTLEETAYFLNLTVRDDRPVVVTGAMRPATATSADGPLNLLNAVRTASTHDARAKGVLVVLNDEINGAREVTKTNTYRVETFRAPDLGLLGYVDGDAVVFYRSSTRRHTSRTEFDVTQIRELPKVDIYYSYVEPNTEMIDALVKTGVKGIVFAGTGAGTIAAAERAALKALRASPTGPGPVLVRSSRVGSGRVIGLTGLREEYDALGLIPGDNLNPQKARILLMLALTRTNNRDEIKRMFLEY